jgi:hypothetical protein
MARRNEKEHRDAKHFMTWVDINKRVYPELEAIYHIPNGGQRNKIVAAKLKAEGVKAGMPDYHLPVALNGKPGLWIELKAEDGRLSKSQKERIQLLEQLGHHVQVCYGWQQCAQACIDYLGKRKGVAL